jgi:hypothetical protein
MSSNEVVKSIDRRLTIVVGFILLIGSVVAWRYWALNLILVSIVSVIALAIICEGLGVTLSRTNMIVAIIDRIRGIGSSTNSTTTLPSTDIEEDKKKKEGSV